MKIPIAPAGALLGLIGLPLASHAQTGEPATFAVQQQTQAWAAAKLAGSPRRHAWVSIGHGDRTIRAFVTYPAGKSTKTPVVVVLHEVFGLTDSTRNTADEIAAMGFITVAPDMLSGLAPDGRGTPEFVTVRAAGATMTALPDAAIDGVINAVAAYGLKLPGASDRLAIVGLSWGGGAAFRYAASGATNRALKAIAVFYDIGPPQQTQGPDRARSDLPPLSVAALSVPVYGFYPTEDRRVMASLPATKAAMAQAGKSFGVEIFPGADHAYLRVGEDPADQNPANAIAARNSLKRLSEILAKI